MRTKAQAERLAKALLKKMKGKGWKIRVWDNIGWHYQVSNGQLTVSPLSYEADTKDEEYGCLVSDSKDGSGGLALWTSPRGGYFKDPNKAVKFALEYARERVDELDKRLRRAERVVGMEKKKK